ncbi:SAM-dependent methyltransferase [Micromonospora sp. NPDC049559]|uniref:SAM-dependent methyltransferase n=1 Tax=Micromonospora sp. NPDC049559 TaxID=3155923 RepID=UPI003430F12B
MIRAEERDEPDGSFLDDPQSPLFATAEARGEVAYLRALGAPCGSGVVRARFADEILAAAVRSGVRQVVCLGAGYDTRAFRLALPADLTLFELESPEQLSAKQRVLDGAGLVPSCRRRAVGTDLRGQWLPELLAAGYRPGEPCLWIAEGLLHYLDRSAADLLIATVTTVTAPGSSLFFDVHGSLFHHDPAHRRYLRFLRGHGAPYAEGFDDPAGWLTGHGWRAEAYLPADLAAGRCPWLPVVPRRLLTDHRHVWYVHATIGTAAPR